MTRSSFADLWRVLTPPDAAFQAVLRVTPLSAWLALGAWLLWAGLIRAPGPHDNDWPLLMWLVKHASWNDPSSLAIGHYGPAQLLLVWWLYPLFGSTLVAAKVLSTLGALICIACLYLMTRRDHGEAPALMAAAVFGLSAPLLQTGQSEFADAPATAVLLAGLCIWWRSEERRGWAAGTLMGIAGLMRVHFVIFSIGSALLAALLSLVLRSAERARGESALAGLCLVGGSLLGNSPGFLLNLAVHGQVGSAVAHTFLGQVLYGVDNFNFFETYAAHPLGQILREQPLDILSLMDARAQAHPSLWLVPLACAIIAFWKRREWPIPIVRHILLISGLALTYFWLFVSPGWSSTPRLLFPITSFNSWLVNVCVMVFSIGFALALVFQLSSSLEEVHAADQARLAKAAMERMGNQGVKPEPGEVSKPLSGQGKKLG